MSDKFDRYREALVVEVQTVWTGDLARVSPAEQQRIAARLHANPSQASQLRYIRLHTGFCREITVTAEDLARTDDSQRRSGE